MKRAAWKSYAFFILVTEIVGAISAFLTQGAMAAYDAAAKPAGTPPNLVFPIVWSILFLLMGIGAARVDQSERPGKQRALRIFGFQLVVNFLWSVWFFNLQAYGFAFLWLVFLWVLILLMIGAFRKVDRTAALLQIPYLLWVAYAGYLNAGVWLLNR